MFVSVHDQGLELVGAVLYGGRHNSKPASLAGVVEFYRKVRSVGMGVGVGVGVGRNRDVWMTFIPYSIKKDKQKQEKPDGQPASLSSNNNCSI